MSAFDLFIRSLNGDPSAGGTSAPGPFGDLGKKNHAASDGTRCDQGRDEAASGDTTGTDPVGLEAHRAEPELGEGTTDESWDYEDLGSDGGPSDNTTQTDESGLRDRMLGLWNAMGGMPRDGSSRTGPFPWKMGHNLRGMQPEKPVDGGLQEERGVREAGAPGLQVATAGHGCSPEVRVGQVLSEDDIQSSVRMEVTPIRGTWVNLARGFFPSRVIEKDGFLEQAEYEATVSVGSKICDACKFLRPLEGLISRMGGKSQLKAWLLSRFPRETQSYVEVFGGSFQVLLAKPWRNRIEIINDLDTDVVHFYRYAVHDPHGLANYINSMPTHEAVILGFRQELSDGNLTGLQRAAAWYICSASAFNAMVDSTYGRYSSSVLVRINTKVSVEDFIKVSERLKHVDIRSTSFERLLQQTCKHVPGGLFVYLDPPYDQTTGYNSISSGSLSFGWNDQVKLSEWCENLDSVGALFVQTNSYTDRLVELYGSYKKPDGSPLFQLEKRMVRYSVAGSAEKRAETAELIISNFNLHPKESQGSLFSRSASDKTT